MQISNLVAVASLSLISTGCVATASEGEIKVAIATSLACMIRAAHNLDDGISDATSVAYAVVGACGTELHRAEEIAAPNVDYQSLQRFKDRVETNNLKTATEIVLDNRARAKERVP